MNLFVYYKLDAGLIENLLPRIKAMQAQLCNNFAGLDAKLMQRPEADSEGRLTLMETYQHVAIDPAAFQSSLNHLINEYQLPATRKTEYFVDL